MEYGIDYILKLPTEDIKTYLESASIIDILAILENIKKRTEMDYTSLNKLEKIEEQVKLNKKFLTDLEKRINIATKTNASKSEIDVYWEQYRSYDAVIDSLTSEKEQLIQNFTDKKQSIFTLAWNIILNAPVSKLEDYRNHLITWLKNRIEAIETNKSHKEITTNTLLEERNYTKEDITAKSIQAEIKAMEDQILNHELILNEETIGKIKSLRAKKESLEHETFTYVCTEKIKTSLKSISNDITKLQMELSNLIHMNVDALKELILADYAQTKEEIKLANYVRIYRSYLENISKVSLTLKGDYRSICSDYATSLNSLENPTFEGETLDDLDNKLKDCHNYIKTLEEYKKKQPNKEEEARYLYSTVRAQGLFNLPFSKEKWLAYFGKYFESLINSIKNLEEKNSQYVSLESVSLKSKRIESELEEYRTDLRSMLDELYNKVLSLYLKNNLYINVSVYDYRDMETLTKYIEYRDASIDKEISEVKKTIDELNRKKSSILEFVSDTYTKIDTDIKVKLNSIFNGTYVKKEEEVPKAHHFFANPTLLEASGKEDDDFAKSLTTGSDMDFDGMREVASFDKQEEEQKKSAADDFNPFFDIDTDNFESESDIISEDTKEEDENIPSRKEAASWQELDSDKPADSEEVTTFDPDDIFGSSENGIDLAFSSENKTESEKKELASSTNEQHSNVDITLSDSKDVVSFDEAPAIVGGNLDKGLEPKATNNDTTEISFDDNITLIDQKAFKDLLEPKEVPDFNNVMKQEEHASEDNDSKKNLDDRKEAPVKVSKKGLKVIKQEPVVSMKNAKKDTGKKEVNLEETPVKTDATEIKERIESSQNDKQNKVIPPLFNPASASDVSGEYNDTNAPIDLNAFLNGNLANGSKENRSLANDTNQEPAPSDKKLALTQDDNINLMDFLSQIENNDTKAA